MSEYQREYGNMVTAYEYFTDVFSRYTYVKRPDSCLTPGASVQQVCTHGSAKSLLERIYDYISQVLAYLVHYSYEYI